MDAYRGVGDWWECASLGNQTKRVYIGKCSARLTKSMHPHPPSLKLNWGSSVLLPPRRSQLTQLPKRVNWVVLKINHFTTPPNVCFVVYINLINSPIFGKHLLLLTYWIQIPFKALIHCCCLSTSSLWTRKVILSKQTNWIQSHLTLPLDCTIRYTGYSMNPRLNLSSFETYSA